MRAFKDLQEWLETIQIHERLKKHSGSEVCDTCGMFIDDGRGRDSKNKIICTWENRKWKRLVRAGTITDQVAKFMLELMIPKTKLWDSGNNSWEDIDPFILNKMYEVCDKEFIFNEAIRHKHPSLLYTASRKCGHDTKLLKALERFIFVGPNGKQKIDYGWRSTTAPLLKYYQDFNLLPSPEAHKNFAHHKWNNLNEKIFYYNKIAKELGEWEGKTVDTMIGYYNKSDIPPLVNHLLQYKPDLNIKDLFEQRLKNHEWPFMLMACQGTRLEPQVEPIVRKYSDMYPLYLKFYRGCSRMCPPTSEELRRCMRSDAGEQLADILFTLDEREHMRALIRAGATVTTMKYKIMVLAYASKDLATMCSMLGGKIVTSEANLYGNLHEEE